MQEYQPDKPDQPPVYNEMSSPIIQPAPAQTVITNQPIISPSQTIIQITQGNVNPLMPRGIPRPWSTEIMGCYDDMGICLCGLFVPCYPNILATDMNESCCVPCCIPAPLIAMRAQVRGRHNIQGNLMNDLCANCWCGYCVLCQLAREVKNIKEGRAAP